MIYCHSCVSTTSMRMIDKRLRYSYAAGKRARAIGPTTDATLSSANGGVFVATKIRDTRMPQVTATLPSSSTATNLIDWAKQFTWIFDPFTNILLADRVLRE